MSPSRSAQQSQRRSANRAGTRTSGRRSSRGLQALERELSAAPSPRDANRPQEAQAELSVVEGTSGLRVSSPSQELLCGGIGLTLKVGLGLLATVSLVRLAGAYQERLDRYGEISAVLEIQKAKLLKAQHRFDSLFRIGGEQQLIQEQDQWIAPNRLRVVWKQIAPKAQSPFPTVEQPSKPAVNP